LRGHELEILSFTRVVIANPLASEKLMTIHIEILTKADCCLCDDAKAIVERVLPDYPATLTLIDIESDPVVFETYKERIPVVRINGEESFVYKAHEITLRKKLDKLMEL
jgi:hypothetical protein